MRTFYPAWDFAVMKKCHNTAGNRTKVACEHDTEKFLWMLVETPFTISLMMLQCRNMNYEK